MPFVTGCTVRCLFVKSGMDASQIEAGLHYSHDLKVFLGGATMHLALEFSDMTTKARDLASRASWRFHLYLHIGNWLYTMIFELTWFTCHGHLWLTCKPSQEISWKRPWRHYYSAPSIEQLQSCHPGQYRRDLSFCVWRFRMANKLWIAQIFRWPQRNRNVGRFNGPPIRIYG